jgi:hypothetical protein
MEEISFVISVTRLNRIHIEKEDDEDDDNFNNIKIILRKCAEICRISGSHRGS